MEMRQAVIQYAGLDYEQFPDTESLKAEMLRRGMQFDPNKERGKLIDELVSTYVDPQYDSAHDSVMIIRLSCHPWPRKSRATKRPWNALKPMPAVWKSPMLLPN